MKSQWRRRSSSHSSTPQAKTFAWRANAAIIANKCGKFQFKPSVFAYVGSINKNRSTSNILTHYSNHQQLLYESIPNLNILQASADKVESFIQKERKKMDHKRKTTSIFSAFQTSDGQPPLSASSGSLDAKHMQAVGSVMFACVTESPLS